MIETHISWVLLTGEYAYKIKKPVNLGFLDFSTLAKRQHFCQEEMRLNGRLAPELYLQVVRITGSEKAPEINGDGPVIEYAVKMRQFPQQQLLINQLRSGKNMQQIIDQTAAVVAGFHQRIPAAATESVFGSAEAVLRPVLENFRQIRQLTGNAFEQQLEQLESWSLEEHQRRKKIFAQRKHEGFIRECHGDLHLGNIALFQDQVVPFDGIEFNENLYWIDVISELAFLVMDLQDHQRSDLAFRILNAYLQQTGDYPGLRVLRYYLVYRAMVRAKVNSIHISQHADEKPAAEADEMLNYLQLATSYTQAPAPRLIICHGLSASGKSTVSQLLLEKIPGIRLRSDVERKRLFQDQPAHHITSEIDSGCYSADASRSTYQRLLQLTMMIIDAGYTAIVDAAFLQQQQRDLFHGQARQHGISLLIVHCQADIRNLRQRVVERQQAGRDVSDADLSVLEHQIQTRQKLTEDELACCITINTDGDINIGPILQRLERTTTEKGGK